VFQHPFAERTARIFDMLADQAFEQQKVFAFKKRL
jgi:hypothetical protein